MFLDFYQLREQPFGVTPDPRFLFLSQSHREALASLFYGIEADRGFVALIAPGPRQDDATLTAPRKASTELQNRVPVPDSVYLA
jgi:hypothetical protein